MRELSEKLLSLTRQRSLIAGVGNVLKGDDGAGSFLVNELKSKIHGEFLDCGTVPENYLEKIIAYNPATLVIVDAMELGEVPGTMKIIGADELDFKGLSTHSLSLDVFAGYLRNRIKEIKILILGIQPKQCGIGHDLSEEVRDAINALAKCVLAMSLNTKRQVHKKIKKKTSN